MNESAPPWEHPVEQGWVLVLRIQPRARRSEVVGTLGDTLKVRVAAPAVDGRANVELIRFLAEELGVPRRSIRIVRGHTGRTKTVQIEGLTAPPSASLGLS